MRMKGTAWLGGIAAAGLMLAGVARAQDPNANQDAHRRGTERAVAAMAAGDMPGPIDSLQDLQDTGKMLFKLADANNDGQISQREATDAGNLLVGGFFFRADQNGDGKISRDEARQARESLLKQKPYLRFVLDRAKYTATHDNQRGNQGNTSNPDPYQALTSLLDTNNDRQLQATELRQAVQTAVQGMFAAADTNRDGQLSPTEINAAMYGMARTAVQTAFQAADADHNGSLSKEEFDKALTQPGNVVFDILDANLDGQLSQQELDRAGRVVASMVRRAALPEAPNSPANLISTGRRPSEVAPVPNIPPPTQPDRGNRPGGTNPPR
jgi:Ca2+-binding EF-hand superfamily protein